ncbi:MAG TPA: hypothetical protein VM580_02750 [Labilithrix sp.]|jgi:hypothetical protein|nr:hypothetical protein [Labilithrix sp.]
MRTTTITMLSSAFVAVGLVACAGDDKIASVIPGIETGTLEQSWTIDGTKDINKCNEHKADRLRLIVIDSKDSVHATEFAECRSFAMKLELKTDSYTGNATFVDANGYPVSKTLQLQPFTILEDRTVTQTLEFKAEDMKP